MTNDFKLFISFRIILHQKTSCANANAFFKYIEVLAINNRINSIVFNEVLLLFRQINLKGH